MGETGAPPKALKLFATGLYSGYLPLAPATWASIFALIIWYLLRNEPVILLILGIATLLLGIIASNRLIRYWGDDPRPIVIDEIAAMFLLLSFIRPDIKIAIVGFLLFRFFDVVKPPPVNIGEKMHGGFGIMADDLIAAGYSRLVITLLTLILG
ncbi:MAG TPA: phosphatidylglycerophosphatase A [bacterium (Candidatus Stahlbacteria)]|nr:phosphatidylglycerophosphatase A [Candidatus Stahlbacteria bacterium]